MTPPKEEGFRYPDWYLEAMAGAAILDERGDYDGAEKVRYLAKRALAAYMGTRLKDSQGQLILGENDSTQLKALRQRMDRLLKQANK